ncbi:preprotein translocase subunit SecG [Uliginosibacterium sp. H1]|uniref:preprotein translocase subunit SecG n=1 Tax=Uliginosibacterium sp. H1 TaxID=3114757 RepID=UPI002E187257|nr:preprotein translocase subunit SecG [Uliginosibacterium sp. H1]
MGGPIFSVVLVLHILVGLALIVFVLLQHGKGADVGASFGGGSAGSLFGSSGSANFLSRTTAILATVFFVTSLGLTYLAGHRAGVAAVPASLMDGVENQSAPAAVPSAPATDSKSSDIPK